MRSDCLQPPHDSDRCPCATCAAIRRAVAKTIDAICERMAAESGIPVEALRGAAKEIAGRAKR